MDLTTLLVAALATARVTRLITSDRLTEHPRLWTLMRLDPEGLGAYLVTCGWCVSVYVGAGVAALLWLGPTWTVWPLSALAFSYVAGWLAAKEGE